MAKDAQKNEIIRSIRVDESVYRMFTGECKYQGIALNIGMNRALRAFIRNKSGKSKKPFYFQKAREALLEAIDYLNMELRRVEDDFLDEAVERIESLKNSLKWFEE